MNIDSYYNYCRDTVVKHQDMIGVQASSFAALFCWYPLYPKKLENQVLAMRVKSLKEIPKESIRKIFRNWTGIRTEMFFQPLFPFIFQAKQFFLSKMTERGQRPTVVKEIAASSLAGGLSGPIANVLNVIIIRMRHNRHETAFQSIRHIWLHSGPLAFMEGWSMMSIRNWGFGGVFFGMNPQFNNYLNEKISIPQPYKYVVVSIASAVPSGILASVLTMPFDNLSVRLQARGAIIKDPSGIKIPSGVFQTMSKVYEQHGWKGFWVETGLRTKQAIVELTAFNIFFSVYNEWFKTQIDEGYSL